MNTPLQLDKRQRAILREMGVRVWQPMTRPVAPEAAAHTEAPAVAVIGFAVNSDAAGQAAMSAIPATPAAQPHRPLVHPAAMQAPAHQIPASPAPREHHIAATPLPAAADASGLDARAADIARMNWAELQTAVAGCTACSLCESRTNTVFGVGPPAPDETSAPGVDWLIVGEAPGENEDRAGEPFVGQAGKLLDNMLAAIKLQRGSAEANANARPGLSSRVFIANVLKCRPPANRNPESTEIARCAPFLKRQVELLQPKVILATGKFAAQSLLEASLPDVQKTPLGKLRGRAWRYEGVPVVVTYHPAYLLRSLPEKAKAWDDLCLAMDEFAQAS